MTQLRNLTKSLSQFGIAIAMVLGICCGVMGQPVIVQMADTVAQLFLRALKLVSLPIIFLSISSTCSGMESLTAFAQLGRRVIKYTLLTTVIAASVALALFIAIDPASSAALAVPREAGVEATGNYLNYLIATVPNNIIQPFLEGNVIGVLFIAMAMGITTLTLPDKEKQFLSQLFASLFAVVMNITAAIMRLMPFGVWAFVTLFVRDVAEGLEIQSLAWYLLCVVLANVLQATIVLPLLLRSKGIAPLKTFKAMFPALQVAFFSKSSSAAMPMAIRCAEEKAGIPRNIASFSLPLCTTINMNACAAFILITVLFVSMVHGVTYSIGEMIPWIFISTLAAVGNAGVPMGCYFLSSALLASMGVPLNILGVILPVYALIDMLESAINVWSDSCVTAIVAQEESAAESIDAIPAIAS